MRCRAQQLEAGTEPNATTIGTINYYADSADSFNRFFDIAAIGSTGGATGNIRFLTGSSTASERMRIDGSGNVGIGTTAAAATLQVSGSLIVSTSAQTTTPSLYVGTNGSVGIGTTSPGAYKLYVAGNAWTTGTWGSSDRRWKERVQPLRSGLDVANALRPVTFYWISGTVPAKSDNSKQVGLIAQEVENVFPELVRTNDDGFKAVAYDKLSVVAIEAIKELKAANDNQAAEISALRDELSALLKLIRTPASTR